MPCTRSLCDATSDRGTAARSYRPRHPERGIPYKVLAEHLETFLARLAEDPTRRDLPVFVKRELRSYLWCGIAAHGFCRVHCRFCGKDAIVAFSCKRRGFCPSCGARRMADTAARLVDQVIPWVPMRQWVLTIPHGVRFRSPSIAISAATSVRSLPTPFSHSPDARRAGTTWVTGRLAPFASRSVTGRLSISIPISIWSPSTVSS